MVDRPVSFIIFCVLIIFIGLFFCYSRNGYQVPEYEKMADRITERTARKLQQEKSLYLIGTGGRMMDDVKAMHMSFEYYKAVDLKSIRDLMVYAIDEYLIFINQDQKIRSYLHNYPFTPENVEIHIFFYNPDRSYVSDGAIYYVSAIDGVINYYIEGQKEFTREAICTETYEEAVEQLSLTNRCASF